MMLFLNKLKKTGRDGKEDDLKEGKLPETNPLEIRRFF